MNSSELHAIFEGEVQGVGFRATARRFAHHLNLVGYVRNCLDGTVELVAQGSKEDLGKLLQLLQQNFKISKLQQNYRDSSDLYSEFSIRY